MAPMPMATNVIQNNTNTHTTTTIIKEKQDPYVAANGITEAQLDREFRIMAGTQDE